MKIKMFKGWTFDSCLNDYLRNWGKNGYEVGIWFMMANWNKLKNKEGKGGLIRRKRTTCDRDLSWKGKKKFRSYYKTP